MADKHVFQGFDETSLAVTWLRHPKTEMAKSEAKSETEIREGSGGVSRSSLCQPASTLVLARHDGKTIAAAATAQTETTSC